MEKSKLVVVATGRGYIPRDHLQLSVELHETDNALVVATVWRLKADGPDGPHVKRDAHAMMFAPPGVQIEAGATGKVPYASPIPGFEPYVMPGQNGADVTLGLNGQQVGTEQAKLG